MSKLSFRARALDSAKPMPVFLAEDLPDLSDYVSINRSVPQMPTGMEKEEEMELHLQQAITAQQASTVGADIPATPVVIPTPKVTSDVSGYERLYPVDYKPPKQLIRIQAALNLEPEFPDYDLDSEDEQWRVACAETLKLEISPLQFEKIMDTLEKQSEYQVISSEEAKVLLQEDDDVVLAVYDYWLNKRFKSTTNGRKLIPRVRVDKRDTANATDPYIGFRRRAEKMQTRKNRKNDEESYEKILKLRHDFQKSVTLLEMVKRREKSKRELLKLSLDLAQKRLEMGDVNGEVFNQLKNDVRPAFQFTKEEMVAGVVKCRKPYKKRKTREDRDLVSREWLLENAEAWNRPELFPTTSSRPDNDKVSTVRTEKESEEDSDGPYVFKRRAGCVYNAPIKNESDACWPWEEPKPHSRYVHGFLNSRLSSNCASLRYVGLVRKRVGRGGRVLFDRLSDHQHLAHPRLAAVDEDLPSTSFDDVVHRHPSLNRNHVPSFRPPNASEISSRDANFYIDSSTNTDYHRRFNGTSSSDSLNAGDANLPLMTLSGPNGNLDVRLKIGVAPSLYSFHRNQLVQHQQQQNSSQQFARISDSFSFSNYSKLPNGERNRVVAYSEVENGRTPTFGLVGDEFLDLLDSRRAFDATAAVMTPKQAQHLADHYQKGSPNNSSSFTNNYNLSSTTPPASMTVTVNNNSTANETATTNGETNNQTSRMPPPQETVERVLSPAVILTSANRCNKKYNGIEKIEQDLIRTNLHFLSS